MNAVIIVKRHRPGEKYPHAVFAEYPIFEPGEKINAETERFIEAAISSASGGTFASVTHHIYLCSDEIISFSLDVQRRNETSLLYLRRFCFNWAVPSGVLIPLESLTREYKRLRLENNGSDDYSLTSQSLFMHKNTFTLKAGEGCRRSQYKKFLTAAPYDLRALRGGAKNTFLFS